MERELNELRRRMITSGLAGLALAFLPGSRSAASALKDAESITEFCFDCEPGCEPGCMQSCQQARVNGGLESHDH